MTSHIISLPLPRNLNGETDVSWIRTAAGRWAASASSRRLNDFPRLYVFYSCGLFIFNSHPSLLIMIDRFLTIVELCLYDQTHSKTLLSYDVYECLWVLIAVKHPMLDKISMNVLCLWAAASSLAAAPPRRSPTPTPKMLRRAAPPEIQGPQDARASKRAYFRHWDGGK